MNRQMQIELTKMKKKKNHEASGFVSNKKQATNTSKKPTTGSKFVLISNGRKRIMMAHLRGLNPIHLILHALVALTVCSFLLCYSSKPTYS